jgi:hypothetical protein
LKIKLLDDTFISSEKDISGNEIFPPLKNILKVDHACGICPVRQLCNDNNEFDCQNYGMFFGFYFDIYDAIKLLNLDKQI